MTPSEKGSSNQSGHMLKSGLRNGEYRVESINVEQVDIAVLIHLLS